VPYEIIALSHGIENIKLPKSAILNNERTYISSGIASIKHKILAILIYHLPSRYEVRFSELLTVNAAFEASIRHPFFHGANVLERDEGSSLSGMI